jgi:hypothetical protein
MVTKKSDVGHVGVILLDFDPCWASLFVFLFVMVCVSVAQGMMS